ncbi:MAG: hypothetical protein KKD73_03880 [Proteobacteria bacterium]|nr:hypothetical protein [Pseudomonadota bacterium]MBU1639740.1 hypothetical protein [Pseudomonadota bacterium]
MVKINMVNKRFGNIFLVFIALTLLGGCAAGTTQLQINHNTLNQVSVKREGNLLVKQFVDARKNTIYIGNKRNGFGMVLGHVGIHGTESLESIMTRYFAEALQENGYRVTIDNGQSGINSSQQNFDAIIEGSILEFWMDLYMAVWHRVNVDVKAIDPASGNVLWGKEIAGSEKRTLWVGATGEYERIVREAITKTLNAAMEEFASEQFYSSLRHKH